MQKILTNLYLIFVLLKYRHKLNINHSIIPKIPDFAQHWKPPFHSPIATKRNAFKHNARQALYHFPSCRKNIFQHICTCTAAAATATPTPKHRRKSEQTACTSHANILHQPAAAAQRRAAIIIIPHITHHHHHTTYIHGYTGSLLVGDVSRAASSSFRLFVRQFLSDRRRRRVQSAFFLCGVVKLRILLLCEHFFGAVAPKNRQTDPIKDDESLSQDFVCLGRHTGTQNTQRETPSKV